MEYVMHSLIRAWLGITDSLGIKALEPIQVQRNYIISVLRKENLDMPETSDDEEGLFIGWWEKLEMLEDLHYYEDVYFWDFDFLQLDLFTEEELLASLALKYLEIENIGDKSRKFVLPPEWLE